MPKPQSKQSTAAPEAEEPVKRKGLSAEAWTAVSAIAVALISGTVAVVTTVISHTQSTQPSPAPSESAAPTVHSGNAVPPTAAAIAGNWSGEAKTSAGESYTIQVDIRASCQLGEKCGTISVLQVPCYGDIALKALDDGDFEFDVSNFDSRSSESCTPGAGEHFKSLPDGRLSYHADWGVEGILAKAP